MLDHFTNYEYYSVGSATPEPQRLRFSPKPHNKIGVYFGWRWIFLGWAIDADGLYGKKSGKKRGTEFDLSLYSSKLGVDIIYRRTGNSYKIHDVTGFSDRIPTDYSEDFDGLKVKMKGLNLYYIFNNRRFSIPPLSANPPINGATQDLSLPDSPYPHTIWILTTPSCPISSGKR